METDIREAILRMLEVCKRYEARAFSLSDVISKILWLSPKDKSALNASRIQEFISDSDREARRLVDEVAAKLTEALANDRDVLNWLKEYPSMVATSAVDTALGHKWGL
jgi:hypothetical protein